MLTQEFKNASHSIIFITVNIVIVTEQETLESMETQFYQAVNV